MAIYIQILLSLICMVLADKNYTNTLHFDQTDFSESLTTKEPLDDKNNHPLFPLSLAKDRELVEEVPIHDDVYSYNLKRTYDRVETYREHMDLFSKRRNRPSGILNTLPPEYKLDNPSNILANQLTNINDNHKYTITKFNENNNENPKPEPTPLNDKQNLENKKNELEPPSKTNGDEISTFQEAVIDDELRINATKDIPENTKEREEYMSRQNIPTNVPKNNNDNLRNTVVHIDIITNNYGQQQPPYQFNQMVNPSPGNSVHISIDTSVPNSDEQINNRPRLNPEVPKSMSQLPNVQNAQEFNRQPISANVPIRANKPNLMTNGPENYPQFNHSPSSVLIYVNGQLILVPGIELNPHKFPVPIQNDDEQGINISVQSPVQSNAISSNGPNQNTIQRFNNLDSMSNTDPKSGVYSGNLSPGSDHGTNNDSRFYYKPDGYEKPIPFNQI